MKRSAKIRILCRKAPLLFGPAALPSSAQTLRWPAQRVALIADGMAGRWWPVTARPLDAARDALIALQGQLIAMLAASNAALAERVTELEERLARLERTASRNSGSARSGTSDGQSATGGPPLR
jgi:hypothetical protein